jgi:hypothetical protein
MRGLADYGYADLAAQLADAAIENAMAQCLNERYHADTGAPIGVANYAFACAYLSMMTDGLSRKYSL